MPPRTAARQLGVSVAGIGAMRRSVEQLTESGPYHGGHGGQQIDLGLALLSVLRKPHEPLALEDIAAWCGCARNSIWQIEQRALRNVRERLLETTGGQEIAEEVAALFGNRAA